MLLLIQYLNWTSQVFVILPNKYIMPKGQLIWFMFFVDDSYTGKIERCIVKYCEMFLLLCLYYSKEGAGDYFYVFLHPKRPEQKTRF